MAFKGEGYFDFEVEPVSFRINKSGIGVSVDDSVMITDDAGDILLNGYIDDIDNELANPVEVTVYPYSLKLKDISAGSEVVINEDTKNEEKAIDYDTAGYKSVRNIVKDLATQASRETVATFRTDATAIPDPLQTDKKRYFGNILSDIVRGRLRLMEDSMHFRGENGILYLVKINSGFVIKTLAEKGKWGSLKFQVPVKDVNIGLTTIKRGSWLSTNIDIPPFDVKIPGLGAYYDIYRCEYGGITHLERITWFGDNKDEIIQQLNNKYGDSLNQIQYGNVSNGLLTSLLKEMGYNLHKVYGIVDTDMFNSYALVKAYKTYNDIFGRDMLLSIETSGDFYYKAHYRNRSIMEILKDLAVITDRYLYIDPDNTIHLQFRNAPFKTVTIDRKKVLKLRKRTSNQEELSVSVQRYVENEDKNPSSYGIMLRDNEWSNIEREFKEKFKGRKTVYEWKVLNPPGSLRLMRNVLMDGTGYGTVIKTSFNHAESTAEFTTEVPNV
ncbi:MAG: hypothetical protein U5N56_00015 [Candidatus Marinimicrobia bacterium]|nr:hypothetical protein [Candidatus Neomarinimicrobiota bacterium]